MIIAAYAGVGKSYFCKYIKNSVDLHVMPYKWILPSVFDENEAETIKAAPYLIHHPAYIQSYVLAILEANLKYDYVIIPSDITVLKELKNLNIPFVLCYPDLSLKDTYQQRYIKRGNTRDFINIFIGQWDERILDLMDYSCDHHIVLQEDEYLLDIKDQVDNLNIASVNSYSKEQLDKIEELKIAISVHGEHFWLYSYAIDSPYALHFNLLKNKDRNLIYKIGKICYEYDLSRPYHIDRGFFEYLLYSRNDIQVAMNDGQIKIFMMELKKAALSQKYKANEKSIDDLDKYFEID